MDSKGQYHNGFRKYPKIKTLGDRSNDGILTTPGTVVIEEKVDGANFGFYVKDGIIYFCSRNQNLKNSEQIKETGIPNKWVAVEPVLEAFNNRPEAFAENLYVYGESLNPHRIKYDNIPGFVGYDVLNLDTNTFVNWSCAKTIIEGMGLPFINVVGEFAIPDDLLHTQDGLEYLKTMYQKSAYRDGGAEGIVLKRYDTQQFAKIVDDAFKEKVKKPRVLRESTTERAIADMYATPARIEKIIYKLRDDGCNVDMTLMRTLFTKVVDDILEEEGDELNETFGKFNGKTLGSVVAQRCAPVLKDVIMRGGVT